MASPTIESLCCLKAENNNDFTKDLLQDFKTVPYNIVSIVASLFGIVGALYQVLRRDNYHNDDQRTPPSQFLKTRGRQIIRWLALADLMAAAGILVRSVTWLSDKTIGASDGSDRLGEIFCISTSAWIHYFYTVTYMWTVIYALDVKLVLQSFQVNQKTYHLIAWVIPAILCFGGLLLLYLPDLNCYSFRVNPFVRFLPNYLSTFVPIAFVMVANPLLYYISFSSVENLLVALRGRFTEKERRIIRNLKLKFFLINLVFYVCWIPNILNGIVIWTSWHSLPKGLIIVLWYAMAILNPLQAVFNCFVYRAWDNGTRIQRPRWIPPRLWFQDDFRVSPYASSLENDDSSSSCNEGEKSLVNIFQMNNPDEKTPLLCDRGESSRI